MVFHYIAIHLLFIHSSADEHLSFQLLQIMSKAAIGIHVKVFM